MADRPPTENNNSTTLAVLATKMDYMQKTVDQMDQKMNSNYVTKDQFDPVKRVVYGLVALALVGIGTAIVNLVIVSR